MCAKCMWGARGKASLEDRFGHKAQVDLRSHG